MTNNTEFFKTLSESINKAYMSDCQTKAVYDLKQEAIFILEETAKKCMHASNFKNTLRVWLTGSSINGFGNKNSDADMCLVTGMSTGENLNRKQIVNLLHQMRRVLENERRFILKRSEVIPAKVPILRVFLQIDHSEVQCDVNVDNHIGIRNSWLLRCYSELDDRIRPFIYMIKKFAKAANLNDAQSGSMSTYSWLLLAINFLQVGLENPVLPCVQALRHPDGKLYDEHFKRHNLEYVTSMALSVKKEIKWKSKNTMNPGELFYRFLFYYSVSFNFSDWIISIRVGKLFMRLGDESLRRLHGSIKELKYAAENAKKRPRLNSGIFVKKPNNEDTVTISDSEDGQVEEEDSEEEVNESSIVKQSSSDEEEAVEEELENTADEEDDDQEEVQNHTQNKTRNKAKTPETDSGAEIQIISDDESDEQSLYDSALKIFGSQENALLLHPDIKHKSTANGNSTQLDSYENKLLLDQRLLIEKAATKNIVFDPNEYPLDRITICIEEPFQKDNVARAVFDKEKALRIIKTLRFIRQRIEDHREKCDFLTLNKVCAIASEYLKSSPDEIQKTIAGNRRKRRFQRDSNFVDESESGSDVSSHRGPSNKKFKNHRGQAKSHPHRNSQPKRRTSKAQEFKRQVTKSVKSVGKGLKNVVTKTTKIVSQGGKKTPARGRRQSGGKGSGK